MATPNHWMHLYKRPKQGTSQLGKWKVVNYKHKISANGWFDTCSFDIVVRSDDEAKRFLDQFIGCRFSIIVDNPCEPAWEGYINRIDANLAGAPYSIGLDAMANAVDVTYSTSDATPTTLTASVSDSKSQALYGIKFESVDMGLMIAGAGATTLRDTVLSQRAWPKASIKPGKGTPNSVHIEGAGFYNTLSWEGYRNAAIGNAQIGNLVDTVIGAVTNGTTFFDNTDLAETVANTLTTSQAHIKGERVWDVLLKLAEIGNSTNYHIVGITPTKWRSGTCRAYYRAASTDILYTAQSRDSVRIRNKYGQLIDPWRVHPDAGIEVNDVLVGQAGVGDNPMETYIMKIEYDAERQTCIFSGDDDLTAEGAFNYKRRALSFGKRNGARRTV